MKHLDDSLRAMMRAAASQSFMDSIEQAASLIADAFKNNHKLLIAGNGGSAADAQHIAGELVGTYLNRTRPPLPTLALTTDTSVITAWANDTSYDRVFARQVAALGRPGDVFLAISTSGCSRNIIIALEQAYVEGVFTILLTGQNDSPARTLLDERGGIVIAAPDSHTPLIQQLHQVAYHAICGLIEEDMNS